MNFVLICIDTLRYDHLSCHGNAWIKTPNFEAFARESVVFENAYVGSYATIPHRTGDASDYRHVPEYLKNFQPYWRGLLNVEFHK